MYKSEKKEQKEQKEIKIFQDASDINLSDDCPEEKISSTFKSSFRCTECCLVPFLTLKENDNKVTINCINGHFKEMPLNEYFEKGYRKNMNNIQCSDCGLTLEPKKRFKFCAECIKIFCRNCLKKHNNNQITANHETISLKKMDTFCCLHKNRYTNYCEICQKNICEDCFYLHNNHQIVSLKEIKLSKNQVKEFREKLNKENTVINEIVQMFNNAISSIQKKFDDVIKNKRQIIQFKKIIEEIYEAKESNFQIIQNINKLKFNNEFLHLESDMNELDVLFELFNYLNCIDYNIDVPNSLSSANENLNQFNNLVQEESFDNFSKEKIANNLSENSSNNNEKCIKNNNFIYTKKNKKLFDNYLVKNEEEKNIEKKYNNFEDNVKITGSNKLENIENEKIDYIGFETKNNLYKDIINNNLINKKNKIKKYSKKIIQEKIGKKTNENNYYNKLKNKEEDKDENKDINEFIEVSDGVPVLSENNIIIEEINTNIDIKKKKNEKEDNKEDYLLEDIFNSKNNKNNIFLTKKIYQNSDLTDEENENNINKINFYNGANPNLNINKEYNINNKNKSVNNLFNNMNTNIKSINVDDMESESTIKTFSSFENDKLKNKKKRSSNELIKAKLINKLNKDKLKIKSEDRKDRSMDDLRDKFNKKVRDKSKEKRVKIKRSDQLLENNLEGYDELHYNSFEMINPMNQQKNLKQINCSNIEISYTSDRLEKKIQTMNDSSNKNIEKIENNSLKYVDIIFNKQKNFDELYLPKNNDINKIINDEIIQKESEIKEPDLNPEIINENDYESKKENEKINKEYNDNNDNNENNEDNKNNENNDISNENISNDISNDDMSNDISNDISNDNVSNDDISFDNNGEKKIKKRKKKIIKKKRKIRKLNLISDNNEDNINKENNFDDSNNYNTYNYNKVDGGNNNEKKNLKKQKLIKRRTLKKKISIQNNKDNKDEENEKDENEQIITITKTNTNFGETDSNQEKKESLTKIVTNKEQDLIKNQNQSYPTPNPLTLNNQELEVNQNKGKIKKKIIKKTKIIKKKKKKKLDLSKSFDDVHHYIKTPTKKLSSNSDIFKRLKRSNSFDNLKNIPELEYSTKINSMKFENGISCLLEVSDNIFAAGNLIGDIKIIERKKYKEILTIREHDGTINSLFKLKDGSILSSSADRLMKKISLTEDNLHYEVDFIFDGYENYVFKGIELFNGKIISCSWDNKLYLWEKTDNNQYTNSLKFNENQRVEDILEISKIKFCSISDNELKIWNSNKMTQIHSIRLQRGILTPNSLCKLNDEILITIFYHTIHLIDLVNFTLISSINMDEGNLSCITKLNDGSFLIAEDINTDNYCIFYLKQYIIEDDELQYISFKKDKFYKSNKNNDKEIRALIQFSDGVIAEGITGEYNGKDSGDIFFYQYN